MVVPRRHGDLDIEKSVVVERRERWAERIAQGLFVVIIIAGLAGVFGTGPLSSATAQSADGSITLEYERFGRWDSPLPMIITVRQDPVQERQRLWIDQAYLDHMQIEKVFPAPQTIQRNEGRHVFEFSTSGAGEALVIELHLRPERMGRHVVRLGREGGEPVSFRQFIFP